MSKFFKKFKNQHGFTLIELMATLAILALIIAIAVPAVGNITAKAKSQSQTASIELMERAGELAYVSDTEFSPGVKNGAGVVESEAYSIPYLIDEGFLKMELDNDFNKSSNYVKKVDRSGTFIYKGDGESPVVEDKPEPNDASDFIFIMTNNNSQVSISGYIGESMDVVIPDTINGLPVTDIGQSAFEGDGLLSITIPDSVVSIGWYAFKNNNLTSIVLPSSIDAIRDESFQNNQLSVVIIPESVIVIGTNSFDSNPLTTVTILGHNPYIYKGAFNTTHPSVILRSYKGSTVEVYANKTPVKYKFEAIPDV